MKPTVHPRCEITILCNLRKLLVSQSIKTPYRNSQVPTYTRCNIAGPELPSIISKISDIWCPSIPLFLSAHAALFVMPLNVQMTNREPTLLETRQIKAKPFLIFRICILLYATCCSYVLAYFGIEKSEVVFYTTDCIFQTL